MITAQDIREKCFEKARIGGYAMDEVDDFLDELANDAAASQQEIATLNAKMKYLADKIREYQGSEEAMNMALVSGQGRPRQDQGSRVQAHREGRGRAHHRRYDLGQGHERRSQGHRPQP